MTKEYFRQYYLKNRKKILAKVKQYEFSIPKKPCPICNKPIKKTSIRCLSCATSERNRTRHLIKRGKCFICSNCGKEDIYRYPCEIKKGYQRVYCSKQCSNKSIEKRNLISKKMRGKKMSQETKNKLSQYTKEKSSNWKGGKPKCKECKKEVNFRSTYCLNHKHKLWTKEHWESAWAGSRKRVGIMPANMKEKGAWSNIKSGHYMINGISKFFRSKWEANYALYLDYLKKQKQIKNWEFEPDVFIFHKIKFGTRSYRPDFKVTANNGTIEYHEVKGYMDSQSKTKLKRMKKYYPQIKIILIERKQYEALKKWERLLNFY